MKLHVLFFLALWPAWLSAGPAEGPATNALVSAVVGPPPTGLDDQQKLGPGDRVTYRVLEDQDDPRSLTVTESGDLDVPYLGLVHAAGKTSLKLAREIKPLLEKTLYYQATVIIALEVANRTRVAGKVYVTGQVQHSGGYEITAGETLTISKAILNAGGFSDFADRRKVRLIHKSGDDTQTTIINVQEIFEKGKLEQDLTLQPNDLIVVPARLVNF